MTNIPEMTGGMIITAKGVEANRLENSLNAADLGLLVSTMINMALDFVHRSTKGELEQVFVRHTDGYMVTMAAGPKAILTVFLEKTIKLGLTFLDLKRSSDRIATLIPADYPPLVLHTETDDVRDQITQLLQHYDDWQAQGNKADKKVNPNKV